MTKATGPERMTGITLRDIAQEAGVSVTAVSMALHNSPRISSARRQHIQGLAAEMGYRHDPMLAALSSRRWRKYPSHEGTTLAILADGAIEAEAGIREGAAARGYQVEVFQIGDYADPKRLADVLYHRGIVGLLVAQIFRRGFSAAFDWSRFIAVACAEGYERPPIHLIMPNHYQAVQEAWDHAWAGGCRRIGLALFNMPGAIDVRERQAAFLERQQQVAREARIPLCLLEAAVAGDQAGRRRVIAQLGAWMEEWKLDAVLGFNSLFYWYFLEIPARQRRACRFIDLWMSEPPITHTGMFLPQAEIGRRSVEYLDALIRGGVKGLVDHTATLSLTFTWHEVVRGRQGSAPRKKGPPSRRRA